MSQSSLRTQRLTAEHLPLIDAIEQRAYPHPWTARILQESLASNSVCTGLFDAANALLGYAFVLTAVGEAQVLNITIAPEQQGRGFGRYLMEHILLSARKKRCTTVLLEVRRSNKPARRLYESLGFATLGVRKGYYPLAEGREDALVLGLELL